MSRPREQWIDVAKGLGVLLVVLGHNPLVGYGALRGLIYSFHMPMFFAIAGLTLGGLATRQWLLRIGSLLWIYLFVSLAFVPLALSLNSNFVPSPEPHWLHVLLGILYGTATTLRVDTLWFLPALALGMLLAWPLIRLGERQPATQQGLWLGAAAALLIALGAACLGDVDKTPPLKQMTWNGAGSAALLPWSANVVPFIAGFILLGRALIAWPGVAGRHAMLLLALCLALWAVSFTESARQLLPWTLELAHAQIGPDPAWTALAALAGCLSCLLLARHALHNFTALAWLGRSSLPIMVLHPMLQHAIASRGPSPWLALLAFVLAALLPALLDHAVLTRLSLGQVFFYPRSLLRKYRHAAA